MSIRGVELVLVAVLAATGVARADGEPWVPATMIHAGANIRFETPPGAMLVVELSASRRIGGVMWSARGGRALFAGPMGGGSSDISARMWEVLVGPSWWSCARIKCAGLFANVGLQRLLTRERGGDVDPGIPPPDDTQRDLTAVFEVRFRYLLVGQHEHLAFGLDFGLRLKARVYSAGDRVERGEARFGGGLLLGLGAGGVF